MNSKPDIKKNASTNDIFHLYSNQSESKEKEEVKPNDEASDSESAAVPADLADALYKEAEELNYPTLTFEIDNLFIVGSPIAMFLSIRGTKPSHEHALPHCRSVYNVFHPYDPIAYRIEPWIDKVTFQNNPPVTLPTQKRSRWFMKDKGNLESGVNFLGGKRYDYVLQLSSSLVNISQYTAMIPAHKCYWTERDLMYFVLRMLRQ
eukprot:TRINITY_DN11075_c0_g1_i1.p1 TRINITY_DN11075_c0_g1~~TRINITY_DN11075_c0_g1_i1.p1  ORF type:complete len:205 (-),score=28.20 TRINITY_DN11075_c0_g1_i1:38-652(-)